MFKESLEMIAYQNNDDFPDKLQLLIEGIYKEINNKIYMDNNTLIEKSTYIKDIEKLIKDRFNMICVFDPKLHVLTPAGIIPFFQDYLKEFGFLKNIGVDLFVNMVKFNSIITHKNKIDKEKKNILNAIHNKRGYIDLKNARVGGYLSEIKHYLLFDFFTLIKLGFTEREVVAVILHELGHAFHGLEVHFKLEKSNSTIVDILNNINDNKQDRALYIFKKHFNKKEFESLSVSNKKEIYDFYGVLALSYLEEIKTQMINSKYDETNFENLADSFASRFNMYKDIVSGLHKLDKTYYNNKVSNRLTYSTFFIINLLLKILIFAVFGPVGIALFIYILVYVTGNRNTVMRYDFPIDRYNRIKNSLINNLKDINLPEEIVKNLLEQYVFITNIIEKSNFFEGTMDYIANIIILENRNNEYYINLQQTIENNLNNLLFVSAQKLKVS